MRLVAFLACALPLAAAEATLDGEKVYYESLGKGSPAVVFIHGWTCDSTFWRLNSPAIARHHRVILIDLPGHGRSAAPHLDYTPRHFARAVDAVLTHARVPRAVLVGHSMGVTVIREVHRLVPARVAALVFVDGFILKEPMPAEARERFLAPMRAENWREHATRFITSFYSDKTPPPLRDEILTRMLATPHHVRTSAQAAMTDPAAIHQTPIAVPVLSIHVNRPGFFDEAWVRSLAPRLEIDAWDGYGHFLMMEDPARFNRRLLAFLASLPRS